MEETKRSYAKKTKSRLQENIKALSRLKNIRIQDIEKEIGRATGYLSRVSDLSSEELFKISKILGESMENLMTRDYVTEFVISKELEKLRNDIRKDVKSMMGYLDKDDLMRQFIRITNEIYGGEI